MNKLLIPKVFAKRLACRGLVTLAAALFLFACGENAPAAGPNGQTPGQQLAQLEKEGKLPKLDRSSSVAGTDTDGNGVRDDIDAYLRQRFLMNHSTRRRSKWRKRCKAPLSLAVAIVMLRQLRTKK